MARKKIMQDSIQEIHLREVYYDNRFTSRDNKYYEGIVSTGEFYENVFSFSKDYSLMFMTRTSDWTYQSAFVAHFKNGLFTETFAIKVLDSIYNGSISPSGSKIIYSLRNEKKRRDLSH